MYGVTYSCCDASVRLPFGPEGNELERIGVGLGATTALLHLLAERTLAAAIYQAELSTKITLIMRINVAR